MKNNFSLRLLAAAALCLGCATNPLSAAISVDSAITSGLFEPYAVAVDPDGSFYITDGGNHRVLRVPSGLSSVSLLAGQTGVAGSVNGVADAAQFNTPRGIVLARGGVVVADSANQLIRFVSLDNGTVTNLAGTAGAFGSANGQGAAARFRYPLGLAADSAGNIYIADSQNHSIRKLDVNNNVTTIAASGFLRPGAVAVGDNGELWVADTGHHCIKRIDTNGVVTLVAGVPNVNGTTDSSLALNARFFSPLGLLWMGGTTGLLISDSDNHSIRRLYYNTNFNSYSVTTFAGTPGIPGSDNGPALEAKFRTSVGIASDQFGGGFLIVDKGNNLIRRINTGAVQPAVSNPVIGWVDRVKDAFGAYVTLLQPVISGVFNNDVVIATPTEAGTSTYFTYGPTSTNPFEDNIPDPAPGVGNNPPLYRDGEPYADIPPSMVSPQPDVTIKAIGVAEGRRSSSIVQARFIFKAANPTILGDNAGSFKVQNITVNAEMWYTWDGSEPTNNNAANPGSLGPIVDGETLSYNLNGTNGTFKIKAFRANYRPSDTITKVFLPENFAANTISFGFENGEASSDFVAAAGQRFYAPVTLTLLPGAEIYSIQFNVVATNEVGSPLVDGSLPSFQSTLEYPTPPIGDQVGPDGLAYTLIPPVMAVGGSFTNGDLVTTSLLFTNPAINLLGVGWLERRGRVGGIYPANEHDLIRFSQAHDTVFLAENGKVILGGYSFVVPLGAPDGSAYNIQLGRASATSDGVSKDVFIQIPTNGAITTGPINGEKRVTVGSRRYVVGDAAPFRWFNAGDFGNTNLLNNDVLQVFQSAVYHINMPLEGSDMFDAMDSSNGTTNNFAFEQGSDYSIDNVTQGDGSLNVDDVYVTFRRSLDPSLKWYARFWQNGTRQAVEVPNVTSFAGPPAPSKKKSSLVPTGTPTVGISVNDVVAAAGATVQVPVRVHITGGLPIRVAMIGLTVEPLDGSPAITAPIDIVSAAGLGAPSLRSSLAANSVGVAWLNNSVTGVSGDAVIATLTVQVPASAGTNAAYRVRINNFSCSENGIALFRKHVRDGVVTLTSRTGSSWGDTIPDLWRLRFFGAVSNTLSAAGADPDHDGITNLDECRGGTNPQDAGSALRLNARPTAGGVKLTFPTGLGRTYVVESAPELSGPWTALSTSAGDGIPREVQDSSGGKRFYRVRAQ